MLRVEYDGRIDWHDALLLLSCHCNLPAWFGSKASSRLQSSSNVGTLSPWPCLISLCTTEAALDQDEHDQDILLLKQILNSGGIARISDHISDPGWRAVRYTDVQ
jgi:hypothetical protein